MGMLGYQWFILDIQAPASSTAEQLTEWEPGAVVHLSPAFRRGRGPEWKIQGARYIGTLVEHLRRQTDVRVARWVR